MSAEEEKISTATNVAAAADTETTNATDEEKRSDKILRAKELYSHGSRNFLVKCYAEAADELSEVCALYEELYGELSDELGMPYLLYAKSLIALALDENKFIDVPDEQADDDDDDDEDGEDDDGGGDGKEKKEKKEICDTTTASPAAVEKLSNDAITSGGATLKAEAKNGVLNDQPHKPSIADDKGTSTQKNGSSASSSSIKTDTEMLVLDDEKPSTSNGKAKNDDEDDEENEATSSLQLAWEILELAAIIFSRQGKNGLSNLAEVQTELANIEFENNILEAAREDYGKALKIYEVLTLNYRRAMAEIHYKIGLTYLMQQLNKEGAGSLKEACKLIDQEIDEIKAKKELTEKDNNNIQDMEETKQEIWAKIAEIEDTQAQNIAEVRAALDSYIKPLTSQHNYNGVNDDDDDDNDDDNDDDVNNGGGAGPSCSSTTSTMAASKPTDISHLIKRKKPDDAATAETETTASPAKRPAV